MSDLAQKKFSEWLHRSGGGTLEAAFEAGFESRTALPVAQGEAVAPAVESRSFVEWRLIEDGLPDSSLWNKVLVYTEGADFGGEQFFHMRAEDLYPSDGDHCNEIAAAATHWAPAPIPGDYAAPPAPAPAAQGEAVAWLIDGVPMLEHEIGCTEDESRNDLLARAVPLGVLAAPPAQAPEARGEAVARTDSELRAAWRQAGGSFHGPHIETGTMPEVSLLPFLRSIAAPPASRIAELEREVERLRAWCEKAIGAYESEFYHAAAAYVQAGLNNEEMPPEMAAIFAAQEKNDE